VLLYGPPGSGKTLLAQAVAHQAGAALLDLSPAATACKYPGREAALMVHMVSRVMGRGCDWCVCVVEEGAPGA
jgi:ATP-dependent 26S proteasome regulatory subunit